MRINYQNKTMDMEVRDMNYILPAYLRSYQFHSQNELPTRIIFPMFASVKAANGVDIPIEYVPPLEAIAVEIQKDGSNVAEVTPEQEVVLDEKDAEIARLKAELTQTGQGEEDAGGTQTTEGTGHLTSKPNIQEVSKDTGEFEPVPEEEVTEGLSEEEQTYEAAKADQPESPARKAFTVGTGPAHRPQPDRKPKQPPGGDIGTGQPLSDMHPRGRDDQRRTARDLKEEPSIDEAPEKEFGKEIKRDEEGNPIVEDKPDGLEQKESNQRS